METYLVAGIVVALLGYLLWVGAVAWRLRRLTPQGEESRKS